MTRSSTRLALISDQHANDIAFAAALRDIERIGVDQVVCLGDVIQAGAQPRETAERLIELDCPTVLGNSDALLLELPNDVSEPIPERFLEVREWTLGQLDPAHLDFIRTFQPTVSVNVAGARILGFHGSPRDFDDLLIPENEASTLGPFLGQDVDLLAGGHTHLQWTRLIDGIPFVNPGSIGYAYDRHQPQSALKIAAVAEYALVIVDRLGISVEFRRVPYPLSEFIEQTAKSGRPYADEWAAQWT